MLFSMQGFFWLFPLVSCVFLTCAVRPYLPSQLLFDNYANNITNKEESLWFSVDGHQLYRKAVPEKSDNPPSENQWDFFGGFEEDPELEERLRHHLHYVMSSTAEQPDSGGRTSDFSIWLTLLIAGLAAAILS